VILRVLTTSAAVQRDESGSAPIMRNRVTAGAARSHPGRHAVRPDGSLRTSPEPHLCWARFLRVTAESYTGVMDTEDEKTDEADLEKLAKCDPVDEVVVDHQPKVPVEQWIPEMPLDFHEFMRPRQTGR
jgi:hypothetical protein